MTEDFQPLLDLIEDEESRSLAESYLVKYWLGNDEYFQKWRPIERSIFDFRAKHLPDLMFNDGFDLFPLVGGDIFINENDFLSLQRCLREVGDQYFVVVQNTNVMIEGMPFVRFRYPINCRWDELMSGGVIGTEHFNNGQKDYFLFGDSAIWGRYVANSWVIPENRIGFNPLNIMGFRKEYSALFILNFQQFRLDEPQITPEILFNEWLPDTYKELST